MPATRDRMQDVFPISFDFKRGEQPSSEKLTKWVQLQELAFQRVVGAIGDPWDYSVHINGSSSQYNLSWEKLQQTSLGRFGGPSSIVSPFGNNLAEAMGSIAPVMAAGKNSWRLGFPLIKASASSHVFTPTSSSAHVESIDLDADISLEYSGGGIPVTEMTTRQADIRDVDSDGDYHIDWATGVVTSYTTPTTNIKMTIASGKLHFFGAGAPWATHNVIPDWKEPIITGVVITYVNDAGGVYTYTITLPDVGGTPRVNTNNIIGAPVALNDSYAETVIAGTSAAENSQYRLPMSLLENLEIGDQIPEGFIYLYDNITQSIIPLTTFTATGVGSVDPHVLSVDSPDLGIAVSDNSKYRLITTGASLADQVSYLMTSFRDNVHVGLHQGGASVLPSLSYTTPISHSDLTDRYSTSEDPSVSGTDNLYSFKESNYPTNPHPQYLNRAGYMVDDESGNTANAMRGDFVLAAYQHDTDSYTAADFGNAYNTARIAFGSLSNRIDFAGARLLDDWVSGSADRLGFGILGTGIRSTATASGTYGAITIVPRLGLPLYIKGDSFTSNIEYRGACLGFDLGRQSEMNYIKLMAGIRTGTYDVANVPVRTFDNSLYFPNPLLCTKNLDNRLLSEQIREFRFRGIPYIDAPWNAGDSLASGATGHTVQNTYEIEKITSSYVLLEVSEGTYPAGDFKIGDTVEITGSVSNNVTFVVQSVSGSATQVNIGSTTALTPENPTAGTLTTANDVSEFNRYFTSPGIVGADFFNVYSNAIFFSDTGDGRTTSFTDRGEAWLDNADTDIPSGLYYYPQNPLTSPYGGAERGRYVFTQYGSKDGATAPETTTPFEFGWYYGARLNTGGSIIIGSEDNNIELTADNNIELTADGASVICNEGLGGSFRILGPSNQDIQIESKGSDGDIKLNSENDIRLYADDDIKLYANYAEEDNFGAIDIGVKSTASSGYNARIYMSSSGITLSSDDLGDITIAVDHNNNSNLYIEGLEVDDTGIYLTLYDTEVKRSGSSIRYKENVSVLEDVSWIYDLTAKRYNFKANKQKTSLIGFIAEEVEEINRGLVVYHDGEPDGLFYESIFSALVKAVQDQKKRIDKLETQLG